MDKVAVVTVLPVKTGFFGGAAAQQRLSYVLRDAIRDRRC
jgi:hypothetical protein